MFFTFIFYFLLFLLCFRTHFAWSKVYTFSCTKCVSHTQTHTHTHIHPLLHSLSHTHTYTLTHKHSLSQMHTHIHTHSLIFWNINALWYAHNFYYRRKFLCHQHWPNFQFISMGNYQLPAPLYWCIRWTNKSYILLATFFNYIGNATLLLDRQSMNDIVGRHIFGEGR